MIIQWYPGHMTKARREMTESLKVVDIIFELIDARIPISSRNPDIDEICGSKPRIILLNKSDLADSSINKKWVKYFRGTGLECLEIDSLSGKGIKNISVVVQDKFKERNEKLKLKGVISKPVRALIAGIPNVGKSSLINRLAGRSAAKTGDRPGVTKGRQWIRVNNSLELLDTPGILWPKFEDEAVGLRLAFTGAIKDEIMDSYELAIALIDSLRQIDINIITSRYKIKDTDVESHIMVDAIARSRGSILPGGEIDRERISRIILDEFRAGKLGKISLETPS